MPAGGGAIAALHGRWRWLAPALACLMLMSVTFNGRNERMAYFAAGGTNTLIDALLRNPTEAAYLMAGFHSERNGLRHETFDWTNRQGFFSSIRSLPLARTNSLIH